MKLYKVINKDAQAKDGGEFDYKEFLPKGNKKGKWTPIIKDISECSKGYHVTPYWNMFLTTKDDVKLLLQLPNFDYDVFEEISGITKAMIMRKLK